MPHPGGTHSAALGLESAAAGPAGRSGHCPMARSALSRTQNRPLPKRRCHRVSTAAAGCDTGQAASDLGRSVEPPQLGGLEFSGAGHGAALNPDEGGWRCLKRVELRNVVCAGLAELRKEFAVAVARLGGEDVPGAVGDVVAMIRMRRRFRTLGCGFSVA